MYNPHNIQYIFRQSSAKVWNFYFDERSGLCHSTLSKRNAWTEPVSLQKNLHSLFYADMDTDDCFHIFFQNSQGNLLYGFMNNGSIRTSPVLNSKNPYTYNKHLYLVPFKNNVNLFYTLRHNNSVILAHQVFSNGAVSPPKVIDYVTESEYPYSAVHDKLGNIYVFYQCSDGKYLQIGYKKYISIQKVWGDFIPITKYGSNAEFPHTIIDGKGIIHICCQRRSDKQYELVYQQKVPDKNIWSNEIVIHSSAYSFDTANLVSSGNKLIVFWVRDDVIYYSSSEDSGNSWSKASKYHFTVGRQLLCLSYKTNMPHEIEKISAPCVPGSFINGFKLAFYQEPSSSQGSEISAEDLRHIIVDSLKLLKGSVDELRESDTNILDDITRLTAVHQTIERDLIKCSVKLNLMESEINQLKQAYSRFESSTETINKLKLQTESRSSPVLEEGDIKDQYPGEDSEK